MRVATSLVLVAACLLAGATSGCGAAMDSPAPSRIRARLFPPSPAEMVDMTFDADDADARRRGIVLLSGNDWGLAEPYLKGYALLLANDRCGFVRSAAARALGKAGNTKYLPEIVAALADESPAVRCDAAVALDRVIGGAAVAPLREHAAEDSSADVRAACVKALRHYRRDEVAQTLLRCLSDESLIVRRRARGSLVALFGREPGREAADWTPVVAGGVPTTLPAKQAGPWWDVFGLRRKGSAGAASQPRRSPQSE